MNSQAQISGYLAPNGYFYNAPYWCHMNTASKIVKELNLHKTHKYDLDEDIILLNGFVCIRISDVSKRTRDFDGKILLISDKQQNWFVENWNSFNDKQKLDILDLIEDFGLIKSFNEKIKVKDV